MKPMVFGLLVLISISSAMAEEPAKNHSAGGQPATGDAARAAVKNDFQKTPDEAGLLAKTFGISTDFIVGRYGTSAPAALEKIKDTDFKKRDESGISKVLSELFGMKDNTQVAEMIPELQKEKEATAAAKAAGSDRYLEETKRLFWAAKYINGESVKSEEAEEFYKFFRKDLAAQLEKNAEFKKKIADNLSGGGDKEAVKAAVRNEVNHESLKAFLDAQASSKDPKSKKFAAELADTLSFKDAAGNKFLDFQKGAETQRLHLGKNTADVEKALTAAANQPAMAGSKFVPAIVGAPTKQWFQKNGKFESGSPDGFTPPAGTQAAEVARNTNGEGGNAGNTGGSGSAGTPGAKRVAGQVDTKKPTKEDVQGYFDLACAKCHGPNGGNTKLTATATGFTDGKTQTSFAAAIGKINSTLKMSQAVGAEIKQLEAWRDAK